MILKIEMWDEAAKIGPTMVPDCFYSLNNCRMLIKKTELQGKIVEKRIRRLDEEVDKEHECFSRLLECVHCLCRSTISPLLSNKEESDGCFRGT